MSAPERAALPQGEEKRRAVTAMFDAIAGRYDLVNRMMTFGLDQRWRRRTIAELGLGPEARVVDLASGTGDLCMLLAEQRMRPVGVDLSAGMLGVAAGRHRVPLVRADIGILPFPRASFDGATCGFALRNVVDVSVVLAEMARVVRRGGRVALLEVAEPAHPLLHAGHQWYFSRVVPRIGGLLSDAAAYRYLPRSVAYLAPPEALRVLLADAGFANVERLALSGGVAQLLTGTRT